MKRGDEVRTGYRWRVSGLLCWRMPSFEALHVFAGVVVVMIGGVVGVPVGHALSRRDAWVAAHASIRLSIQQEVKVTPPGPISPAEGFGGSAIVSGDGDVALIGAAGAKGTRGAVWVFVREKSRWVRSAALAPRGEIGAGRFGLALALSANGKIALVGAPLDDRSRGAAWVFARTRSGWHQQGSKLIGGGEVGAGWFGFSVALSGNGQDAVISGPADRSVPSANGQPQGHGAIWAFRNIHGTWTQEGPKVSAPGGPRLNFGLLVAVSTNDTTALIGSYTANKSRGAAWVYVRSRSGWKEQGGELTPNDAIGAAGFGDQVALSANGDTALVGGQADDNNIGAAWVFHRSGTQWTEQAKLVPRATAGQPGLGVDVALSATGSVALIGAWYDDQNGAAWIYTHTQAGWKQQQPPILGTHEIGHTVWFGAFVSLSANATTALISGERDDDGRGAAWFIHLHP